MREMGQSALYGLTLKNHTSTIIIINNDVMDKIAY